MSIGLPAVILASNSPRRKELLASLDIDFTVDTGNNFQENFPSGMPLEEVPLFLSEGKSAGFHRPLVPGEILLTADTMVLLPAGTDRPAEILGKPRNAADAARMLRELSGRRHQVITGVTLRSTARQVSFADTTDVWFQPLTEEDISYYIEQYRPFDKAGAYAIQEWIGHRGISRIEGSYFNVMGLPVHRVYEALVRWA